jgi:hypothetical protein
LADTRARFGGWVDGWVNKGKLNWDSADTSEYLLSHFSTVCLIPRTSKKRRKKLDKLFWYSLVSVLSWFSGPWVKKGMGGWQ